MQWIAIIVYFHTYCVGSVLNFSHAKYNSDDTRLCSYMDFMSDSEGDRVYKHRLIHLMFAKAAYVCLWRHWIEQFTHMPYIFRTPIRETVGNMWLWKNIVFQVCVYKKQHHGQRVFMKQESVRIMYFRCSDPLFTAQPITCGCLTAGDFMNDNIEGISHIGARARRVRRQF